MKKDITIDITPLLDVLLIVLFAVLLNVNATANERSDELNEAKDAIESLEENYKSLENVNELLSIENEALTNEVSDLNNQLNQSEASYATKYSNMQKIIEALSQWLNISEEDIAEMVYSNEAIDFSKSEADFSNTDFLIENIFKYEVITQKFVFIDISVDSTENKVYINDEYIITLSSDEWYDESLRFTTISKLSSGIDDYIDNIEGGYSFILITYKHDDKVYSYISNIITNAIDDVRSKYQDEKIFDTEYIVPSQTTTDETFTK